VNEELRMFDKSRVMAISKRVMDGSLAPQGFYEELTKTLAEEMGCARASVWIYPDAVLRDRIRCLKLYDSTDKAWSEGTELQEQGLEPYFEAMRKDNLIVAADARLNAITNCFTEVYFEPLGIYSLLDVGINIGGQPWGLFCCEHTTDVLQWTPQHVEYLRQVGTLLGFALKKAQQA
jgi:GAF domain-containing protein